MYTVPTTGINSGQHGTGKHLFLCNHHLFLISATNAGNIGKQGLGRETPTLLLLVATQKKPAAKTRQKTPVSKVEQPDKAVQSKLPMVTAAKKPAKKEGDKSHSPVAITTAKKPAQTTTQPVIKHHQFAFASKILCTINP